MAVKQKVSRKDLLKKPDEFITFTARTVEFVRTHEKQLWAALITVITLVVVLAGVRFYMKRLENQAFIMLANARESYTSALETGKGVTAAQTTVNEVMTKYPRSSAADLAAGLLGRLYLREGKYDKAIEAFQKASGRVGQDPMTSSIIQSGLAYAHEGRKEYQKALDIFSTLAKDDQSPVQEDAALSLGRIYASMKDAKNSRKAYEDFLKKFPASPYAQEAREAKLR